MTFNAFHFFFTNHSLKKDFCVLWLQGLKNTTATLSTENAVSYTVLSGNTSPPKDKWFICFKVYLNFKRKKKKGCLKPIDQCTSYLDIFLLNLYIVL